MPRRDRRPIVFLLTAVMAAGVALLAIGYARQRSRAEALTELVLVLLSNDREANYATMSAASRYFLSDVISPSEYVAFVNRARLSEDADIRQIARDALWTVSQEAGHRSDLEKVMLARGPLIDVRTGLDADANRVQSVVTGLKYEASTRGPLLVAFSRHASVPAQTEIRCFQKDCENAPQVRDIVEYLKRIGFAGEAANRSSLVGNSPLYVNVIEVWIPADRLKPLAAVAQIPGGRRRR